MSALLAPAEAPFSPAQQTWLAGFFAGLAARGPQEEPAQAATMTVRVLYGTQTGNCEALAGDLAAAAGARGIHAPLVPLDDVDLAELADGGAVVVITSTYGEGDMPDNAELFWEALAAETAPRLEELSYAVLALGDEGYDDFCEAGKLIDLRLEQLGATRLHPRVDCDVDYEDPAAAWIAEVVDHLAAQAGAPTSGSGQAPAAAGPATVARDRSGSPWSKKQPYPSRLVTNRLLSRPGSTKEIRHLELDLGDSGITYSAGDAFAVVPRNDPALVELVLAELGLDGDAATSDGALREVLERGRELGAPSKDLLAHVAQHHPDSEPGVMLVTAERAQLDAWLWGRDVLDVIRATGMRLGAEELLALTRPLQHRAYSISSSPLASPDRIHLTVAAVRHGRERLHLGVCSTFMADRLAEADEVGVFLQPNTAFRLPADGDVPVVMIGPGTGVAPFRGFLQERAASGATGQNWLFFGDQHRATDFIYEEELADWQRAGVLDRLDLAFSRDQAEKIYVQTRMREHAADLFDWLERGAHVYVCGDASRMAKDVDAALHDVVALGRGAGPEDAAAYVATMKKAKRYVRDVY